MLVKKISNSEFVPLAPSDSVAKALAKMDAWHTSVLPVVETTTGKVIGQVTLEQLADMPVESVPVSELQLAMPVTTLESQHIFEVARQMLEHEIRLIPVVDNEGSYKGIAERKDVLETFSSLLNITVSGSVISVDVDTGDYTLSELVQIIETEDARILGVAVETPTSPEEQIRISFKLNVRDTSSISHSLRRHGYSVSSESQSELLRFDIADRADELLRYLDV
ncbi:MAG: CBS domain-containing protein [Balneolaceae bacterium]